MNSIARRIFAAKQQIPWLGSKFHELRKTVDPGDLIDVVTGVQLLLTNDNHLKCNAGIHINNCNLVAGQLQQKLTDWF